MLSCCYANYTTDSFSVLKTQGVFWQNIEYVLNLLYWWFIKLKTPVKCAVCKTNFTLI